MGLPCPLYYPRVEVDHKGEQMRVLALYILGLFLALGPRAEAQSAGFLQEKIMAQGQAYEIAVWYPTQAKEQPLPMGLYQQSVAIGAPMPMGRYPLVIISHGSGGAYLGHSDTAAALARAGFWVLGLNHPGDTYGDNSQAVKIWNRPQQVKDVLDWVMANPRFAEHIDVGKIGFFGFSAGGFTGLVLAGGKPDFSKTTAHCQKFSQNFDCQVRGQASLANQAAPTEFVSDPRIRALSLAAPALGYSFVPNGVSAIKVPVQIWKASADHVLSGNQYAEPLRDALLPRPLYQAVEGADHFDFMSPCRPDMISRAPEICDRSGFDRIKFHQGFNDALIAFFRAALR